MKNSKRRDDRGGRDFGQRVQMFEAICAECGKKCEVPFRPTGDKPVYCTDCFAKRQGSQPRRSEGRDFGRPRFRDRDKKMFSAICDKCKKPCQVPFQPTPGKPVYCEQCFGKGGERGGAPKGDQLASINAKLDKIINALIVAKIIKPAKEEKAVKEAKPAVKAPKKKVVIKKAAKKSKK
jgi:CxxC-x17-CxxC domain-containing protein